MQMPTCLTSESEGLGDISSYIPLLRQDTNFCGGTPTAVWDRVCPKGEGDGGPSESHEVHLYKQAGVEVSIFSKWLPATRGRASAAGTERAEHKISRYGWERPYQAGSRTATRAEHRTRKSSCMSASIPRRCVHDCSKCKVKSPELKTLRGVVMTV